jgi:site-specific DNA recombinase
VISRLEEFSGRVAQGLGQLDWLGRREIIHTLVHRIEIDHDDVEIVFRVPPPPGASPVGPQGPSPELARVFDALWQRGRSACE